MDDKEFLKSKVQEKAILSSPFSGFLSTEMSDLCRGHLIGYQFSGLDDEKRNLVSMTDRFNAGTDNTNQESMLYYENRLDYWLDNHPNYYLDYKVTPIYQKDELIPRKIELQYVGINYLEAVAKNTVKKPLENGFLL